MELPEVNTTSAKSTGNSYVLPLVAVIVLAGAGYFLARNFHSFIGAPKAQADTNYSPYVDFAENFVIAFNNISYANMDQQRKVLVDMMDGELLTSYKDAFSDPAFVNTVMAGKQSITFQKIERSDLVTTAGNEAAVKVYGTDIFYSDVSKTQKEKQFTYLVDVMKDGDGKFRARKIQKE
jgi:hypothetical protein